MARKPAAVARSSNRCHLRSRRAVRSTYVFASRLLQVQEDERRAIALELPVWDEKLCIQCNKCALVCPHAAIRAKVADRLGVSDEAAAWSVFEVASATMMVAPEVKP